MLEQCSLELLGNGAGFAMKLSTGASEPLRLEFPTWILHQLMRSLPHLDAALQQGRRQAGSTVLAYPVLEWSVDGSALDQGVAMRLRNDRHIDSGFHFGLNEARALHQELGLAISRAAARGALGESTPTLN